ncbi:MAG: DUF3142 domain-containing protein [Verrucomicrobiota bacterium]
MTAIDRFDSMPTPRIFPVLFAGLALLSLLASCGDSGRSTTPLRQWAYVWQREWTPAVSASIRQAASKLDGFVVLGAEIAWKDGTARVLRPPVDWAVLRETGKPIGIAMRIDPFTESSALRDTRTRLFSATAKSLVEDARQNGVSCAEFQVDYDCPKKRLAEYRAWLAPVHEAVKPQRLVITTLPSWLDESEFGKLLAGADGFVLQVHSVPTKNEAERVALCDPDRARRWVAQAGKFGRPFSVALPTYSALIGYDEDGHSLGMATDGVQPAWPPGTRVVEFDSSAEEEARLVADWRASHPAAMERVAWYRLPVEGKRNWRWPTFAAVIDGRAPSPKLEIFTGADNPVDVSLMNGGEVDERLDVTVLVRWDGPAPLAAEALRGWSLSQTEHEARFTRAAARMPRLLPGSRREIGWLRFATRPPLHTEILR